MDPGSLTSTSPALPWSYLVCGLLGLSLLWPATRLLEQLWLRPRRLERALRGQGLRGTRYRFLTGDAIDNGRRNEEAWAKPALPLRCHDIGARVMPFLHSNVREHGAPCFSWFGPVPKVTITDPRLVREVMSGGHAVKKLKFPVLAKLFALGVGSYEGEKWVKHRRILNPAFHAGKLELMFPAFASCCQELVERWTHSLGPDGSWEVDVSSELQTLTGDVISRTAFGSSYLEGRRIFQLQSEQMVRVTAAFHKFFIPGYMYFPTKNNQRMRQINNEIESILRGLIARRTQAIEEGENTKDDLLGLLLESNMTDKDANGQSVKGMSTEEVMEECKLFYFVGMGTTSALITWTMIVLSMHPEWQDRAREEVLRLFVKYEIDYEGLNRLKMVTMIVYEVLRLYPPASAFNRQTYKETEIGGIKYPAGVTFEMPVLYLHHDVNIWGDDVNQFRPDRFAEGISKASKDPGAFFSIRLGATGLHRTKLRLA